MNVRFLDTSVLVNKLRVPGMSNEAEHIDEEFKKAVESEEVLILPLATIIETGNHIAHIPDGNIRRNIAAKFGEYLRKTVEGEAPWRFYGVELDKNGLLYLADHIEENALNQIGVGDMSIKYAYEQFKNKTPGIGRIMIWSTDKHLQGYYDENVSLNMSRRRRK